MAKAKKSRDDQAHRGVAEELCEKICLEYRDKLAFKEIKRSKEYGYEKESGISPSGAEPSQSSIPQPTSSSSGTAPK